MIYRYLIINPEGKNEPYIGSFNSKKALQEWESKHKDFFLSRGKKLVFETIKPKTKKVLEAHSFILTGAI